MFSKSRKFLKIGKTIAGGSWHWAAVIGHAFYSKLHSFTVTDRKTLAHKGRDADIHYYSNAALLAELAPCPLLQHIRFDS